MYKPPSVAAGAAMGLAIGVCITLPCVVGGFCMGPDLLELMCPAAGAVMLISAAVAAIHAHRQRAQWDRYERHCCIYCGYDLRSNVERCSECGRRVPGLRALHRDPNPPPQAPQD